MPDHPQRAGAAPAAEWSSCVAHRPLGCSWRNRLSLGEVFLRSLWLSALYPYECSVSFVFCPLPPPPRTAPPCCTPGHRLSVSYQPCSVLCGSGLGLCRSQPWLEGLYAALSVNIRVHPGAPCSPSQGSARLVSVYALLVLACVGDICGRLFADDKCH